jgi:hypothetical protein
MAERPLYPRFGEFQRAAGRAAEAGCTLRALCGDE